MKLRGDCIDLAGVGSVSARHWTSKADVGAGPPGTLRIVRPLASWNCFHEDAGVIDKTWIIRHDEISSRRIGKPLAFVGRVCLRRTRSVQTFCESITELIVLLLHQHLKVSS